MSQKTIQLSFFIVLTLALFVLSFFTLKSYLGVIFISSVFATVFYPLYQKILFKFKGRESLSSITTVFIILVSILIPAIFLSINLLKEAVGLYNSLLLGGADKFLLDINNVFVKLSGVLNNGSLSSYFQLDNYFKEFLGWLIGNFDSLFSIIFGSLFNFILMLLTMYYLFIYGEKIKKNLIFWSPLPDSYDESVIAVLHSSVDAVIRGRLLVSVAQGLFLGLGFYIFGVGSPVLWGFVGGFASLIPIVGTSIITIPAIIYLFVVGKFVGALSLLIWSAICVGFIDNILSFFFLKGKIQVHPLVILFSILGGIEFFGAIGFLIGPVILSTFFAFMKIYPFIVSSRENKIGYEKEEL